MERDGLTEDEAKQRIAAQWPLAEKAARADHIIRTDGPFEHTVRQVMTLIAGLRERTSV